MRSVTEEYFDVDKIIDEAENELKQIEDSGKVGSFREGAGFVLRFLGVDLSDYCFGMNRYSMRVTVYAEEDPHAFDPIMEDQDNEK